MIKAFYALVFIMKYLFSTIAACMLLVSQNPAYSFEFTAGGGSHTERQYRMILAALRNNPFTRPYNNGIRQIDQATAGNNAILLRLNDVDLVFQASNLYLVGFYHDQTFFHFQDVQNPGSLVFNTHLGSDTRPRSRPNLVEIPFAASYRGLEGHAGGVNRENIRINARNLQTSIERVTAYANRTNAHNDASLSEASLRLIIAFSEGARFANGRLADPIATHLRGGTSYIGSTFLSALTNQWQSISAGTYGLGSNAHPFLLNSGLAQQPNRTEQLDRCVFNLDRARQIFQCCCHWLQLPGIVAAAGVHRFRSMPN